MYSKNNEKEEEKEEAERRIVLHGAHQKPDTHIHANQVNRCTTTISTVTANPNARFGCSFLSLPNS